MNRTRRRNTKRIRNKRTKRTQRMSRKKKSQRNKRKSMKLNMSENNYRKLLSKKRLSKNQKSSLNKALHIKYCKCVKDLKYGQKNPAAYGICANSVYKNRGYEMPPRAARDCEKYYK